MSDLVLTEDYLAKIAGWEVLKQARSMLASGKVLSSDWNPPVLKGGVMEGPTSYRCGLVIKGAIDIENMCGCRASRGWGTICAHSVAVGLHHIRSKNPLPESVSKPPGPVVASPGLTRALAPEPKKPGRVLQRAKEGAGVPARIHVIFPPNLPEAIGRGKIMVYFQGDAGKGLVPLNSLPLSTPFALGEEDGKVLDEAERLAGGDTPGMLMLTSQALAHLLQALSAHPRVTIGKSQPLVISKTPWRPAIQARLEPGGEIELSLKEPVSSSAIIPGDPIWIFRQGSLQPLGVPAALSELLRKPVRLPRSQVPIFLSRDWPQIQTTGETIANFKLEDFSFAPQAPRIHLELTGGIAGLQGKLSFAYGDNLFPLGAVDGAVWLPDPKVSTRYSARDPVAEQAAQARLASSGFSGPHSGGLFQLAGQNAVLKFFARDYQRLQKEWKVILEERLEKSSAANIERIEPRFEISPSGEQWFDLNVAYRSSGGEQFSQADIQRLLLSGQSHMRLKNGKFALLDTGAVEEFQEVLLDCAPQQHEQGYRIKNAQAGFLESALRDQSGWQVKAPAPWKDRAAQQRGAMQWETPPLGDLETALRPYQKQGVGWMHFLRRNGFGGILADEMGLGKTLQTLAFLQSVIRDPSRGDKLPSLIVCPTSLVFNWVAESQKFTPGLNVLALHGPKRHELFREIANADVVITSYALVRRDAEQYRGIEFDTVALDEAQHIKNRQTQNALAVKAVRARHRLVLTGTPLENSVLDLWSIFDFLMPGYLGTAADFKERYEAPIAREKDKAAQSRLARRIKPFLLRRLKQEVAKDLPERIEQVSFCELTDDQQSIYQQTLQASRQEILNAVDKQGLQKSRMVILTALLRLRQICCDIRLLNLEKTNPATSSGKLELFEELLEEALDGGHRLLVFSQFVSMLTLIKESLTAKGIEFSYLDGSTVDRGKVVQEFQASDKIPVFLISLKAGGVGLNLTGADTVIHFDPWWNPAVEDQATGRAHRIGQTRVVTSYKLITRGTVEEKILNLQTRKRELIKATLDGEEALTSALTWEELQSLFE